MPKRYYGNANTWPAGIYNNKRTDHRFVQILVTPGKAFWMTGREFMEPTGDFEFADGYTRTIDFDEQ